jgi:hypothetical protein
MCQHIIIRFLNSPSQDVFVYLLVWLLFTPRVCASLLMKSDHIISLLRTRKSVGYLTVYKPNKISVRKR